MGDVRYPELKEDLNRRRWAFLNKWNIDISEHKYIESPVYNYKIFDYLGYNEIDIVKIYRPISTYVPIEKCKPNEKQKELMINNDGRLPFKIQKKKGYFRI